MYQATRYAEGGSPSLGFVVCRMPYKEYPILLSTNTGAFLSPGPGAVVVLFIPCSWGGVLSEQAQGVEHQVPGEEQVELAEPEELAAMAPHGSLGLFSLLLCEDEECIPGQEAGNEDIQEGNVFPEEIY